MVVRANKPYQLLIADDDCGFRSTICSVFEPERRLETIEAQSGEQAIEVVEKQRIDIVLLDMHMDVLTGVETMRILKSIEPGVPCILISGDVTEEVERDANDADAYSILKKPVRKVELVTTVATAICDVYEDHGLLDGMP